MTRWKIYLFFLKHVYKKKVLEDLQAKYEKQHPFFLKKKINNQREPKQRSLPFLKKSLNLYHTPPFLLKKRQPERQEALKYIHFVNVINLSSCILNLKLFKYTYSQMHHLIFYLI